MPTQVTAYTLSELRESFPSAYERVHERWASGCTDIPWADETMDSLRACIDACGGSIRHCSLSNMVSILRVEVDDEYSVHPSGDPDETEDRRKDADWLFREVLAPLGYVKGDDGAVSFPGLCPWTGYCADEDFIEATYKALLSGDTLTEALEGLAHTASLIMEADCEQAASEESMEANWSDRLFASTGDPVK